MKTPAILSLLALSAPALAACAGSAVGAGPVRPGRKLLTDIQP